MATRRQRQARRARTTLAGLGSAAALLCGTPAAAQAEHIGRPAQAACRTSAHFVIHCDAGTPDSGLDAAVADFEDAYSREVTGGGGTPNAGLAPPVNDGDGRTDVYIMVPPGRPDFTGGIVYRDPNHVSGRGQAAYIFMTPGLSPTAFRFRAAHEFMHVLLRGYFGMYGPRWEESFANWGAEQALPDVDPGDNNFGFTERPFDCTAPECGQGYWQWLFLERQSEDFGVGFVEALLRRAAATPSFAGDFMLPALRDELAARTGRPPEEALRLRFADYARSVWDPAAWTSSALRTMFDDSGPPGHGADALWLTPGFPDTDSRTTTLDHLSAHYVELRLDQTGTEDDVRLTVTPPSGQLAAQDVLVGPALGPRTDVALAPDGTGSYTTTLSGPFAGRTAVLPLVNDSETADAQPFTWRAQLLEATVRMRVDRQRLRTVLKRGLVLKLTSTRPLRISLSASVDARTARRYKLGRRRTRISGIVRRTTQAGARTATLTITSAARRRLAKAKHVPVEVSGTATFPRGTRESLGWRGTLAR